MKLWHLALGRTEEDFITPELRHLALGRTEEDFITPGFGDYLSDYWIIQPE